MFVFTNDLTEGNVRAATYRFNTLTLDGSEQKSVIKNFSMSYSMTIDQMLSADTIDRMQMDGML
jgi:hypothetical protein